MMTRLSCLFFDAIGSEMDEENFVTGIGSKIRKVLKVTGIVVGVIIFFSVTLAIVFHRLGNRPFPLESLELKDAKLLPGTFESRLLAGNLEKEGINPFQVRVTNKEESLGVKEIKVSVNFYGKDKSSIDGAMFILHGVVPPRSTRLLQYDYLMIKSLPAGGEWTSDFSVLSAKRTWILD